MKLRIVSVIGALCLLSAVTVVAGCNPLSSMTSDTKSGKQSLISDKGQETDKNKKKPDSGSQETDKDKKKPDSGSQETDKDKKKPDSGSQETDKDKKKPDSGSQETDKDKQKPDSGSQETDKDKQKPDGGSQETDKDKQKPDDGSTKNVFAEELKGVWEGKHGNSPDFLFYFYFEGNNGYFVSMRLDNKKMSGLFTFRLENGTFIDQYGKKFTIIREKEGNSIIIKLDDKDANALTMKKVTSDSEKLKNDITQAFKNAQ